MNLKEGLKELKGQELVSFLATYAYEKDAAPARPTDAGGVARWETEVEDRVPGGPETFDEVERARQDGRLDRETYYAVLERLQSPAD